MSPPQSPAEPTESQDPETLIDSEPPLNLPFPTNRCRAGTDSKRLEGAFAVSVTASRIGLLGLQGKEGKTNVDGYPEKLGLGGLGSPMKESQHPRSSVCPLYSGTGRRGHYTQINNTQMSQEAGLAVSVSSLKAVNIWGDILKKKPGGKAVVGIFCTQSDQRKALFSL